MADDKSEKPTAQRLKKAREDGQYVFSRGALAAVQFVVFVAVIGKVLPAWSAHLQAATRRLFLEAARGEIGSSDWPVLLSAIMRETLLPLLGLGAILFGATLAVHLGLTRFGFSLTRLIPQPNRLSPAQHLKGLPARNFKASAEALLLLVLLAISVHAFAAEHAGLLLRLPLQSVFTGAIQVAGAVHGLLWKAAWLLILFGGYDFVWELRRYTTSLKMTKQEVRQEYKSNEGDPQIKQRIRRLRRDLLRRQMMREVPKATAVIVNPTHFAVALRYEPEGMSCPVVIAKGKNWLALRIRQVAKQNEVPIIENPPLARALYEAVEVGSAISPIFYQAIAETLAYVYRLMGRKLP
ncbi:MAG TPA: EscU/YscU/HrcU family type III secretion system export apparatus switch protein [Bryobacteraceae bacterium]|nr:EscU/YscU/HrcU family type III secretion system export apparatus switch protein [Bryobacteraceae bacterium]